MPLSVVMGNLVKNINKDYFNPWISLTTLNILATYTLLMCEHSGLFRLHVFLSVIHSYQYPGLSFP